MNIEFLNTLVDETSLTDIILDYKETMEVREKYNKVLLDILNPQKRFGNIKNDGEYLHRGICYYTYDYNITYKCNHLHCHKIFYEPDGKLVLIETSIDEMKKYKCNITRR